MNCFKCNLFSVRIVESNRSSSVAVAYPRQGIIYKSISVVYSEIGTKFPPCSIERAVV